MKNKYGFSFETKIQILMRNVGERIQLMIGSYTFKVQQILLLILIRRSAKYYLVLRLKTERWQIRTLQNKTD